MSLYENIHQKVFQLLEKELPSFLAYHSPYHTAYVIEQAEIIYSIDGTPNENLLLIKTAALFHDIGFINQYKNHEEAGCEIARDLLQNDFSTEDIQAICGMIMATKIPQRPLTANEQIVCDADLEYLGTELFYPVSDLLFQELHYIDHELDQAAFRQIQIDFLTNHTYHTEFCRLNREPLKQIHLQQLLEENHL
jgi:uncharacterized protein